MTIVMIAHRLGTVKQADRICLVDQGRILSEGSYDELLATSPQFRQMAELTR